MCDGFFETDVTTCNQEYYFTPITLDTIRIANAEKASKYFQDLHKAFHSSASCKGAFTVCWKCVLIYSVCLFCLGFCLGIFKFFR